MSKTSVSCKAANPATCRFHGAIKDMETALKNRNFNAYQTAKEKAIEARKTDAQKEFAGIPSPLPSSITRNVEEADEALERLYEVVSAENSPQYSFDLTLNMLKSSSIIERLGKQMKKVEATHPDAILAYQEFQRHLTVAVEGVQKKVNTSYIGKQATVAELEDEITLAQESLRKIS